MRKTTLTLPTVHDNGTSKERLLAALTVAYGKLQDAYTALKETAPNGRDLYPQGADAIVKATDEHMDRLRRLDDVGIELEHMMVEIDRQGR